MVKATSFKPLEIDRDDQLKTILDRRAKYKIDTLEDARTEALKHTSVDDLKAFSEDFTGYVTEKILNESDALKGLRISERKLFELMEIDLSTLQNLQNVFEQNIAELFWNDKGEPFTTVEKKEYIFYTKNQNENRNLETINNFIDALDNLEDLVSIQKAKFMQMTQGLLYVDMATAELKINHRMFVAL